jgi:hypothetical protein
MRKSKIEESRRVWTESLGKTFNSTYALRSNFMKQSFRNGQVGLLLTLSVLASGCNPEEYFPVEELIEGADAYCAQATDLNSCQQLADICQPAYEHLEIDTETPLYSACVANPDLWSPNHSDPSTDPADPVVDGGSSQPVPTIEDALDSKCQDLDSKYLLVKKEIRNKKVEKTITKVKVCHMAGNGSSHTIVIACPALKAHVKHHDDSIGACSF